MDQSRAPKSRAPNARVPKARSSKKLLRCNMQTRNDARASIRMDAAFLPDLRSVLAEEPVLLHRIVSAVLQRLRLERRLRRLSLLIVLDLGMQARGDIVCLDDASCTP